MDEQTDGQTAVSLNASYTFGGGSIIIKVQFYDLLSLRWLKCKITVLSEVVLCDCSWCYPTNSVWPTHAPICTRKSRNFIEKRRQNTQNIRPIELRGNCCVYFDVEPRYATHLQRYVHMKTRLRYDILRVTCTCCRGCRDGRYHSATKLICAEWRLIFLNNNNRKLRCCGETARRFTLLKNL